MGAAYSRPEDGDSGSRGRVRHLRKRAGNPVAVRLNHAAVGRRSRLRQRPDGQDARRRLTGEASAENNREPTSA